ncbi:MAG: hypothetical protein SF029_19630 [bacterium]|nr:hypothetical protein [bacterium]
MYRQYGNPMQVIAILIVLVAAAFVGAVTAQDTTPEATPDADVTPEATAEIVDLGEMGQEMLDQVTDDPASYYGQTVTVEGLVTDFDGDSETLNENSFVLREENELFGNESILVLVPAALGYNLVDFPPDTRVVVTGTVQQFIQTDVETQFEFDLDDELYGQYEQQAVLIAEELAISAREVEDASLEAQMLDTVTDDPTVYYGESVTVEGLVSDLDADEETTFENGFVLREENEALGNESILVLVPSEAGVEMMQFPADTRVHVTGTVQQFIQADIESEYGFDLDDELFANYEEQAVLIAESVILAPEREDVTEVTPEATEMDMDMATEMPEGTTVAPTATP